MFIDFNGALRTVSTEVQQDSTSISEFLWYPAPLNAIESLHSGVVRQSGTSSTSPTDDTLTKLIWMASGNLTAQVEETAHHLDSSQGTVCDTIRRSFQTR